MPVAMVRKICDFQHKIYYNLAYVGDSPLISSTSAAVDVATPSIVISTATLSSDEMLSSILSLEAHFIT